MKKTIFSLLTLASLATYANAATILAGLSADSTDDPTNGTAFGGGGLAVLTSDTFLYDIDDPASVLPAGNTASLFHGNAANNVDITITFSVTSAAFAIGDTLFLDLYGRSGSNANRDNDITVEFLDGMTVIGTDTGAGITVGTHSRASFTTTTAGNITGFRVIGGDTAIATANVFALTEVRAGIDAVPEPSTTALLGLGGLALILRRRK